MTATRAIRIDDARWARWKAAAAADGTNVTEFIRRAVDGVLAGPVRSERDQVLDVVHGRVEPGGVVSKLFEKRR